MKNTKMLSNTEISSFCEQIALILNAGITPVEGMGILVSDTKNAEGRIIIQSIWNVCKAGESFYTAVKSSGVFPDYVLHMISIGEESGRLDEVMASLARYYEREENIHSSIKSALSYPLIMILMMFLVILVLLTKVLPIFNQVFIQLGTEMNSISKTFMSVGNAISRSSIGLLIFVAFCFILYLFFTKSIKGHSIYMKYALKFPLVKDFYENMASGRFASGMALTLSSGLDTFSSLDLVAELVDNPVMKNKITKCKTLIQSGANFAEALAAANIFSILYSRMIAVGFRTGNVDIIMDKIAKNYEKETDTKIYNIISVLEPTLVIVLSLIVGLILLSVILPLMGIMASIG
ncbi:MAG: type II secretion system F family protein [Lachnospiraceae bacterium]|nr:type II secretion system F family protein [Lachnospiraceae bacterium]